MDITGPGPQEEATVHKRKELAEHQASEQQYPERHSGVLERILMGRLATKLLCATTVAVAVTFQLGIAQRCPVSAEAITSMA